MFAFSAVVTPAAGHFPKFFRDYWLYVLSAYLVIFGYVWVTTQLIG
jgi:hypothetical protein